MSQNNIPVAIPEESQATKSIQIPNGSYTARIYQVIDLGTQTSKWKGEEKSHRKFRIVFETPTQTHVFREENGPQPFTLSTNVNFVISSPDTPTDRQSTLSKIYKATIGHEGKGENIFKLVGKLISITTEINSKEYANIVGFAPVSTDINVDDDKFAPFNEPAYLYLDSPNTFSSNVFEAQPEFVKKMIKDSPEYEALTE